MPESEIRFGGLADNPGHDCPACDHARLNADAIGWVGWAVAAGFFVLWLTDANLGRWLAAILINWMG